MRIEHVIFASGGNDSVALVQWAREQDLEGVAVAYSNTGWGSPTWGERMERFKDWVETAGCRYYEIESEGMEELIRRKQGWPATRPKFCTYELKIAPAKGMA